MSDFVNILLAVTAVSLISLIGVVTIAMSKKRMKGSLLVLVSFAVGSMLAASFLDLLPEALSSGAKGVAFFPILGIISFFILEKFVFWHHKHEEKETHTFTYLNLIGDALHNFVDGAVIAAGFLYDTQVGIVATIAILFHEIPQEMGDFGVLIYGGFSRKKALVFNFLSALTAVLGGMLGFVFFSALNGILPYLLAFAAGNFIYLAGADLLPELRKEKSDMKSLIQLVSIILGIIVVAAAISVFE